MYSYGPPHMAVQKQDDQHEHTFSNYVRIRDVFQKTCLRRWTKGRSGERGSGISVLPARHDDDDDDGDDIENLVLNNLQLLICHKNKPNLRLSLMDRNLWLHFLSKEVKKEILSHRKKVFNFKIMILFSPIYWK